MTISRLAPTPSGYLHRGNAFNFLLTHQLVRQQQGQLNLRIDDIDGGRYRKEYVEDIFANLEWLGIDYDEGPRTVEEFEKNWSQSLRAKSYQEVLEQLKATGDVYACSLSRKEIKALTFDGIYRGETRNKALGFDDPGVAWRLRVPTDWSVRLQQGPGLDLPALPEINLRETMGDFVVRKKDGTAAYQLASLVDDVDFGVNLIVRGEDLLGSTAAQLYLAELLGFTHFRGSTTFYHHPLQTDANGEKLSKSEGAESLKALREAGKKAKDLQFR